MVEIMSHRLGDQTLMGVKVSTPVLSNQNTRQSCAHTERLPHFAYNALLPDSQPLTRCLDAYSQTTLQHQCRMLTPGTPALPKCQHPDVNTG